MCHVLQPIASSCAKHVILAIPPNQLQTLDWSQLDQNNWLKNALQSVLAVSATKIALLYNSSSLTQSSLQWVVARTDLPLQQVGQA